MGDQIRVLHVIGGGEYGGAEKHILSLLDQFRHSPIQAEVVTFYDSLFAQKLREQEIPVTPIQEYGRFDFRLLKRLVDLIGRKRPDIVHTHGVRANVFGRIASKRARIPVVVTTVHSILRYDYPNPVAFFFADALERWTRPLSHHFVAVSKAICQDLIAKGIDANKISTIHNGIDIEPFIPAPERIRAGKQLRAALGIPENARVAGTTARLVPVKGIRYMIEGFLKAAEVLPDLHLIIVGDGPEKEALMRQARSHPLGSRVHFLGFRQDIPECLAAMDIYLNTSLSEGLALSILEAMAAGKPVIVTATGGLKELISHEQNGLVIPIQDAGALAEALLRLLQDEPLRQRLIERARADVEQHYTIQQMARKHLEIYQQLVEGKDAKSVR